MQSVQEAIANLIERASVLPVVDSIKVTHSLGRILAEDVVACVDVPPADNSAMDGYAFCYEDAIKHDYSLPISQRIPAGTPSRPLQANTAARIFTGGEIPAGADTVAMQENCTEHGNTVKLSPSIVSKSNVRPRGQDITAKSIILTAGAHLGPAEMGLLSSQGFNQVMVYARLKVAIFSTGDELVEPGFELKSGQIYNSNHATLIGLIQSLGMECIDLGTVPDDLEATKAILQRAALTSDIVISAGGVSVGEEDHVKDAVADLGSIEFWRVAIKPGKPLAFGRVGDTPFIGLPGNPASVFVTFTVLARPFLLASQGLRVRHKPMLKVAALFNRPAESREVYLRGRLICSEKGDGVEIYPNQSSGVLSSVSWGDVLVRQNSGEKIQFDDLVDVLVYSSY
jgi:molybdopterin molybdotransferase|tara:strand:- start:128 stop:1321 length:1194 start_codon:yes stop_codon:yes gene_type:complete